MKLRLAAYIAEASEDWRSKYDAVGDFVNGFAQVLLYHKWGFVNEKGEEIAKPKYELVWDFHEGFAGVSLDVGKGWGFINTKGEVVIPLKYDYVGDFRDGLSKVTLNDKWGLINTKNKKVIPLGKYNDEDVQTIKNYLGLGGNLDIILPSFKPIT